MLNIAVYILWHTALLALGIPVLLVFFSVGRLHLRWPLAIAYGLWLIFNSTIAVEFARRIFAGGASSVEPAWLTRWTGVRITVSGEPGHLPGFAWDIGSLWGHRSSHGQGWLWLA
jgi:hypothetical protein